MKKISIFIMLGLMSLALVACQSLDELSRFQRQVGQSLNTASKFDDQGVQTLDSQMLWSHEVNLLGHFASKSDLNTQNQIDRVGQLIQAIIETRFENISIYEENQLSYSELKDNVALFKQTEQTLLDSEKQTIRTLRIELVEQRKAVVETIGDVKTLMGEIQGKFNLEHIDLVISNLEEILEILELRQTFLILVSQAIHTLNEIALSHLN